MQDTGDQGSPILNQRAAQLLLGSIREIILHKIKRHINWLLSKVDCVNNIRASMLFAEGYVVVVVVVDHSTSVHLIVPMLILLIIRYA